MVHGCGDGEGGVGKEKIMITSNVRMLRDTMQIMEQGYYVKDGKRISLKLSKEEMKKAQVLLPDDVREICSRDDFKQVYSPDVRCVYSCENADSFALTRKRYAQGSYMFGNTDEKEILVLNLANPVKPGGGVRIGEKAEEEDLCRKSSLLLSLESEEAKEYYLFNQKHGGTRRGSDALIITPKVEIVRDEKGVLLDDTMIAAVLTCAAPRVILGVKGMSDTKFQEMIYNRILGMLKCAAWFGYRNLVLGAWGCGAFGNDAYVISNMFYKVLKELETGGSFEEGLFRRVDFAVLDHTRGQYNFREFCRNFSSEQSISGER